MRSITIISLVILFLSQSNCKKEFDSENFIDVNGVKFDTLTFTHSVKGWELYSWPTNNDWKYSFLIGTNRLKTFDEVYNNPLVVTGKDSLKAIINKLPANEEIFWISTVWLSRTWLESFGSLQLPSRNIQIEIKEYCEKRDIKLTILD